MSWGEFITRSSIWLSLFTYLLGTVIFAFRPNLAWLVRLGWTVAWIALAAHFISAFNFYHHWSQASALAETARQTNEVFGVNWAGGLLINYVVLALWMVDVGWWWVKGVDSYLNRPLPWLLLWHGFLIFIVFNATVVFKDGVQRWLGVFMFLTLCLAWYSIIKTRSRIHEFNRN